MSMVTEGGGYLEEINYNIDLRFKYNGIYSKFVKEIYFRGELNLITEFGISVRAVNPNSSYKSYISLKKHYSKKQINLIDVDKLVRDKLVRMSYVYEDDLIMCERKSKLDRVKKQIKLEKTLSYKIRKFFKGK